MARKPALSPPGALFRAIPVNKSTIFIIVLVLALPPGWAGDYGYRNENPMVEAMLRMMETFGLIDRDRFLFGNPYTAPLGAGLYPGLGGLSTLGAFPGVAGLSSLGSFPGMTGLGAVPGLPLTPGATIPGAPTLQGPPALAGLTPRSTGPMPGRSPFDGIWELNNGGVAIIQNGVARLFVAEDRYQDFHFRFDAEHLWWRPERGGKQSRYRYRLQNGRLILADEEGRVLLMRRRR